jgi:23S rRNA (cytidine1920-2'-O)/16S rRNA (cytidine1409-2'-O)-methyltransferase
MAKLRIDSLLLQRGYIDDLSSGQRLIATGKVRIDGQTVYHPATMVNESANIAIEARNRFVSRGGEKLATALEKFNLSPQGLVCADIGSSTGGFTDCLLQGGANKVYAIDVGKGILEWRIRQNPKVIVMEKTNARYIEKLPEDIEMVTIDVSFISLKIILPVVQNWLSPKNNIIILVKPQFEADKKVAARSRGVIREPKVHQEVLTNILSFANKIGFTVLGVIRSPITGHKGNEEFLAWLGYRQKNEQDFDVTKRKIQELF